MHQMLPYVIGALYLLADAVIQAPPADGNGGSSEPDPDRLNRQAWRLYCEFRPETDGQWGKKATLSLDKILSLRNEVGGGEGIDQ